MRRHSFAFTVLFWAAFAAGIPAAPPQSPNPLLGQWKVVSGSVAGEPLPLRRLPELVVTFEKDGRWSDSQGLTAVWSTDETRVPKTLDLKRTSGSDRGQEQLCAYEVKGDRLTIAFGVPGGTDRPNRVTASADATNAVIFTFERVKKSGRQ